MSALSEDDSHSFLSGYDYRPGDFPKTSDLKPIGLVLGRGSPALEVLIYSARFKPTPESLRGVWKERWGGRAVPLLVVALYDGSCAVCGHSERARERAPVLFDLPTQHIERLCDAALRLADHHAVDRFLRDQLPESESPIFGIRNQGLLATYVLQRGKAEFETSDWERASSYLPYIHISLYTY